MPEWIKEHKVYVAIGALFVFFLLLCLFLSGRDGSFENSDPEWTQGGVPMLEDAGNGEAEQVLEEDEEILVDVKGAVKDPGVYIARPGDRVIDVIEEAGGLLEDADEAVINFAQRLSDEMVIYVPKIGEHIEEQTIVAVQGQTEGDGKVNLNRADQSQLETLPGVGPSKASAILEFREKNGPFKTIEDLMQVSGFGEKTFEKLKDKITVK